jgi:drug/metabolite transporter (DMT)-like permease
MQSTFARTEKTFTTPVILALLAVYIFWGAIYFAIALALESYPPLLASSIRYLVGGGLLYLYLLRRREPLPNLRQWRNAIPMGAIMISVVMGGTAIAQQWISSSLAAILAATIPAWVALFTGFMGQYPKRREWFGISLGFLGIVLINLNNLGGGSLKGIALMIFVAMAWAFGTTVKSRRKSNSTLADSTAEMLSGGAIMLMVSFFSGERLIATPTLSATLGLAFMALFGSSLVYVAYIYLVQTVRPSIATSNAYVNPAIAVLLGLLIGETITPITWLALGLILASVIILLREEKSG